MNGKNSGVNGVELGRERELTALEWINSRFNDVGTEK